MDFVKYWLRPRRATVSLFVAAAVALLPLAVAWSQDEAGGLESDPAAIVEQFANDVEALTARFEQQVVDVDGEIIESSGGTFQLLRPDRFSWHYEPPGELIVVADGETLWTYDVEFELVTPSPLSDLAASPAMLLSGEGAVGESFDVRGIASDDGRRWIELIPLHDDGDFVSIKIAFRDGVPDILELVDGLSSTTRIQFFDVEADADLRRRDFEFDPPAGVDIIGSQD